MKWSPYTPLIELLIIDEANRLKDAGLELVRDFADCGEFGLVFLEKRVARAPQLYSRIEADFPVPMGFSVVTIMLPSSVLMMSLATVYFMDAEEAHTELRFHHVFCSCCTDHIRQALYGEVSLLRGVVWQKRISLRPSICSTSCSGKAARTSRSARVSCPVVLVRMVA